ncbi:DUF1028 domain-containing protein [Roseobacter sp. N2S]|uniref:DUF1028 domain-containing protein n=1 Tax=Roseobacter sp. N2S TaxID=2663844 RepID=UPI00285F4096|nr:DUF1028 domain-containing protein [Roseobacter sp. N2S]MDR6263548.1 putative Ntn-hydrolase superfamily protein [Roseobacter sp. N2S]
MTFSILVYDQKAGIYGAAAATGSLCVGGWVLRGDAESGLSASQGTAPSTFWGSDVLALMKDGQSAQQAVETVTQADKGRDFRQLSAVSPRGDVASFTGAQSIEVAASVHGTQAVVAGNMLDNPRVLPTILSAYDAASGAMPDRLLAALNAGQSAGGDSRGLLSAALLVVSRTAAPLTLRIDYATDPLTSLGALLDHSRSEPYHSWIKMVPTLDDPYQDGTTG